MPKVVVTFYKNFRFEEEDVSGVDFGASINGSEPRTGMRLGGTNPGPFPFNAVFAYFKVTVVASGGSYKLKIHLAGNDYVSGSIAYNANAAAVAAAFSPDPGGGDPGTPYFEPCGESGGETIYCAVPGGWINVVDVGPGEYEFRLFEDSGAHIPSGASIQAVEVALGAVMEMVPKHDEVKYVVDLEEGCKGIRVPRGKTELGGSRSGTRNKRGPVVGRRA